LYAGPPGLVFEGAVVVLGSVVGMLTLGAPVVGAAVDGGRVGTGGAV
jgi:hypothetical protein